MAMFLVNHPEIIMLAILPIALAFVFLSRRVGRFMGRTLDTFAKETGRVIGTVVGKGVVSFRTFKRNLPKVMAISLVSAWVVARVLLVPLIVIALIVLIF